VSDPFAVRYEVPVSGGTLQVARAGPPADEADAVVLGIHGVTSSLEVWRSVARRLAARPRLCLLAPDLRGRARSARLPGPYGIDVHVADLIDVLDDAGAPSAVVAGHSLGGFVAAGIAVTHPKRVSGLVLVDGGLAVPAPPAADLDEVVEAMVDTALQRSQMTFESIDDCAATWKLHPAFAGNWHDDVDAYARYAVGGEPGELHVMVSEAAVRADLSDLARDERARTAAEHVRVPVCVLRARRGLFNEPYPVLPRPIVDTFLAAQPDAVVEELADTNHYTIVLGAGPGPAAVAAALETATGDGGQLRSTSR
jgi:lipase